MRCCQVVYTAEVMVMQCKQYPLAQWWAFDDADIAALLTDDGLAWWLVYKPLLKAWIAANPAVATGHEGEQALATEGCTLAQD